MPDHFRDLVHDTLKYVKDPLCPKQTLFVSAEEQTFFQKAPAVEKKAPPEPPRAITPMPPVPPPNRPPPRPAPPHEPTPPVPPPPEKEDFSQIKNLLLKAMPSIQLVDEVPDDAAAKRVANAWKEKIPDAAVILLACATDAETLEFLKGLGKAIDQNLAKAKILPVEKMEMENRWDIFLQKNPFQLIIASEGLRKLPKLMKFYRETPATSEFFLGQIPLVPLAAASVYKSLEHKAHLWKTLCQMLKKN